MDTYLQKLDLTIPKNTVAIEQTLINIANTIDWLNQLHTTPTDWNSYLKDIENFEHYLANYAELTRKAPTTIRRYVFCHRTSCRRRSNSRYHERRQGYNFWLRRRRYAPNHGRLVSLYIPRQRRDVSNKRQQAR